MKLSPLAAILLAFALLAPTPSFSIQRGRLADLFGKRFYSHYKAGKCGDNIMRLLDAARDAGIDARDARMLVIENKGISGLGLVNVALARGGSHVRTGEQLPASARNWYHHVILELDCLVYDFDFTNEPKVLPLRRYLQEMFLNQRPAAGQVFVGKESKLDDYEVSTIRGTDYYASPRTARPGEAMRLKNLMQLCPK